LRTLLTYAAEEWEWIDSNPILKLRDLVEPKGRNRYLSDQERVSLLKACKASENKLLYPIVVLALSCGARKSEINCIEWRNVHMKENFIILSKTKNKESRVIFLHGEAWSVINELFKKRLLGAKLVFPSEKDGSRPIQFKTSWMTALERA